MAVDLNERDDLAMIAVQGPNARKLAAQALGDEISGAYDLKPFNALLINAGTENERFVARTGYTGEDGYEIVCANDQAETMWHKLANAGIKPIIAIDPILGRRKKAVPLRLYHTQKYPHDYFLTTPNPQP